MQVTHSSGSDTWGVGSCSFVVLDWMCINYLDRDSSKKLVESKCACDARTLRLSLRFNKERNKAMRGFREVGRRVERIETNLDVDPDRRIPSVQSSGIPNFTTGFDVDPDVRISDANIPKFAD